MSVDPVDDLEHVVGNDLIVGFNGEDHLSGGGGNDIIKKATPTIFPDHLAHPAKGTAGDSVFDGNSGG